MATFEFRLQIFGFAAKRGCELEDPEHSPHSHKIFNFREHTLKIEAKDAHGQGLQFAQTNMHQSNFLDNNSKGRVYYLQPLLFKVCLQIIIAHVNN
jgi:hypothetical protein